MKRTRSPILATLALAACTSLLLPAAQAQPPHGDGPAGERGPGMAGVGPLDVRGGGGDAVGGLFRNLRFLARFLELTDEQVEATRALLQQFRLDQRPIREEIHGLARELHAALEAQAPDPTEVGETVLAIHSRRQQIRALGEGLLEDFKALLTPEQLELLEQLRRAAGDRPGRRGERRGPGGGPGGG